MVYRKLKLNIVPQTKNDSIDPVPVATAGSVKKYDLVISCPDKSELNGWRDGFKNLKKALGGTYLKNKNSGWCCYIAANSEYFNPKSNFSRCFDCPEFPESFKKYEGATDSTVKAIYDWMYQHDCSYEMEGFIAFYNLSTKTDAIKLLKSCPYIGTIYEIDSNDQIINKY